MAVFSLLSNRTLSKIHLEPRIESETISEHSKRTGRKQQLFSLFHTKMLKIKSVAQSEEWVDGKQTENNFNKDVQRDPRKRHCSFLYSIVTILTNQGKNGMSHPRTKLYLIFMVLSRLLHVEQHSNNLLIYSDLPNVFQLIFCLSLKYQNSF